MVPQVPFLLKAPAGHVKQLVILNVRLTGPWFRQFWPRLLVYNIGHWVNVMLTWSLLLGFSWSHMIHDGFHMNSMLFYWTFIYRWLRWMHLVCPELFRGLVQIKITLKEICKSKMEMLTCTSSLLQTTSLGTDLQLVTKLVLTLVTKQYHLHQNIRISSNSYLAQTFQILS
jgi:hypothetical protein